VDYTLAMQIIERVADAEGNAEGAFRSQGAALAEYAPERAALDPLHHKILPRALAASADFGEKLHDGGMVEFFSNLALAEEALVKDRVAFEFEVGEFEGDLPTGIEVLAPINAGGGAAGNEFVECVMVDPGDLRGGGCLDFHDFHDREIGGKKS
jgi:hypothetical protein